MTEPGIAAHVSEVDLADYQEIVRILLVHPLVTERHPEAGALGRIRFWEHGLRDDFERLARYRLDVTPTCARLVKRPTALHTRHPLRRSTGRPFDRRRYAYVCLVLAAVMRSGAQTTVSQLADRLRRTAADVDGLGFDPDVHAQRSAFVDAVRWLEAVGALSACDGSTVSFLNDAEGDALYDVDHDVAHQLFQPPAILQHQSSAEGLVTEPHPESREGRRRRHRLLVTRLLLEEPSVLYADLTPGARAYAQREGSSIAADVERATGGRVERRSDGMALIDVTGDLSDRRFPGTGTLSQAALLLGEQLVAHTQRAFDGRTTVAKRDFPTRRARHEALMEKLDAAHPGRRDGDGASASAAPTPPGPTRDADDQPDDEDESPELAPPRVPVVDDVTIATSMAEVTGAYGDAFSKEYQADPERLLADALDELEAFDLVRRGPRDVVVTPPLARYRPSVEVASTGDQLVLAADGPLIPEPDVIDDPRGGEGEPS